MRYSNSQLQTSASDLANYLGCKHLSKLDLSVALGKRKAPSWQDPATAILAQRGQEHEEAYIKFLKREGLGVVDLKGQRFYTIFVISYIIHIFYKKWCCTVENEKTISYFS